MQFVSLSLFITALIHKYKQKNLWIKPVNSQVPTFFFAYTVVLGFVKHSFVSTKPSAGPASPGFVL